MKLYDFNPAPNPRRVRMFAAEKGIARLGPAQRRCLNLGGGASGSKGAAEHETGGALGRK